VLNEVAGRFHAEHKGLYGYDFAGDASQQVEWVNLRVSGIGPITRPEISKATGLDTPAPSSRATRPTRPVCFDAVEGYVDTPIVQRSDLAPQVQLEGPVVIEEFGSTVPVHPGFTVRVDDYLNLIVTRSDR
jgi:N-methylhydantoinase A